MDPTVNQKVYNFINFLDTDIKGKAGNPDEVAKDVTRLRYSYNTMGRYFFWRFQGELIKLVEDNTIDEYIEGKKALYLFSDEVLEFKFRRYIKYFASV